MPTRSQRHLREFQGYDSSGQTDGGGDGGGSTAITVDPKSMTIGDNVYPQAIFGTGFNAGSVAYFNGVPQTTVFASETELMVAVDSDAYTETTDVVVTVLTDGVMSDSDTFQIYDEFDSAPPSIVPSSAPNGTQIQLDVYLGSFVSGITTVLLDGAPLATTFVNNVQLTVNPFTVPAAGNYNITVQRGTTLSQSSIFTSM